MKTTFLNISVGLMAFLMLLACASAPPESIPLKEKLAKRGYVIGEPVKRLRDYRINGWNSIDRRSVIMIVGASKHYLVTLRSPCDGLTSAEHLAFSTTIGDLTDKDKLVVRSAGRYLEQCYIDKIYPLSRIKGDYLNLSVAELQAAMGAGHASAVELTRFFTQRIADLNPVYHAVINVNPDALEIAEALDQERKKGITRGPLHGIPVLLKDNINSRDPMPTTAGSLALLENYAVEDAPLVAGLRAAGAVILGKTNLSEWANIRSSDSISGWSAVGGFTRNAYRTDLNPCGSSAGSAVAAALNLAPLTVGAELVDVDDLWPETDEDIDEWEIIILLMEMKADMAAYLATAPAAVKVRNMDDLVAFNLAHAEQEMAHFKQEFFVLSAAAKDLDDPQYRKALSRARELAGNQGIDAALEKYRLDLLIAPSFGVAGPLKDERKSIIPEQPGSTQLSAIAAYPGITVPMGTIEGLPLGISFFAGKSSEPVLIRAAAVFENRRGALVVPEISRGIDE